MTAVLAFDIALTRGWFPLALAGVALGALALAVARRDRRWVALTVPVLALASLIVVALAATLLDVPRLVGDHFPGSFYVWFAVPVLAGAVAVASWRRSHAWRRAVALAAVPLTLVWAADLVNEHYAYVPSLSALVGAPIKGQVDAARVVDVPGGVAAPSSVVGAAAHATDTDDTTPADADDATTAASSSEARATTMAARARSREGSVVQLDIPSTTSGFAHRKAFVWLPPAYFTTPRPALPVVVLLAGTPGEPDNWLRAAAAGSTAATYAAAHGGVAPILVFPDHNGSFTGDTECVDGPRGRAESYLAVDVPAFVKATFKTATDPAHWAIGGLSEGGTCAIVLALRHPDVFHTFVDLSGDLRPNLGVESAATTLRGLYGGDAAAMAQHDPLTLLRARAYPELSGWIEVGRNDHGKRQAAEQLAPAATAAHIDVHFVEKGGGHNFVFWTGALKDAFAWTAAKVGLAPAA